MAIYVVFEAGGVKRAICGMNSHWLRGYGDPPPETVIVVGMSRVRALEALISADEDKALNVKEPPIEAALQK
jgi:hypothetical protein